MGPYYAMFPVTFAFQVVEQYSKPAQLILDPFAGRASSVYAAAALRRVGYGIEINPVGWLFGHVKLRPAPKQQVLDRISIVKEIADSIQSDELESLPDFYAMCYSQRVLRFLLAARKSLLWETNSTDATLMAFILIYLHGKADQSLSNQMRQGKSMSPDYSVRWWADRNMKPPDMDPVTFMEQRIQWRYAKGTPDLSTGSVILGDSTSVLRQVKERVVGGEQQHFDLLFTSPPYYAVTDYHYDQWLRRWMLGGPDRPSQRENGWRGKFQCRVTYRKLLQQVFASCAEVMSSTAFVYVRTDARQFTRNTTINVLQETFPQKRMTLISRPFSKTTQTALYGDKEQKPGEVDIILRPKEVCAYYMPVTPSQSLQHPILESLRL